MSIEFETMIEPLQRYLENDCDDDYFDLVVDPILQNSLSFRRYQELKFNLNNEEMILIHQMGKVGSSSVYRSLKNIKSLTNIYHTHSLNKRRLRKYIKNIVTQKQKLPTHLVLSMYLTKEINKGLSKKRWKIITLTREPIARNISAFFQNLEITKNMKFHSIDNHKKSLDTIALDEIISQFLEKYNHSIPLTWLDFEIQDVFGIDVFSKSFQKAKGYEIIRNEYADLLLLKLESLNQCHADAFQKFLGLNNFELKKYNDAANKDYYDIYNRFKERIILPNSYLKEMYESKYSQHFYSQAEINLFKDKWSKIIIFNQKNNLNNNGNQMVATDSRAARDQLIEGIPFFSSEKNTRPQQQINVINETDLNILQKTVTLLRRATNYYLRWPIVLAASAIALNTAAMFEFPFRWALMTSGTTFLLLLIGHAASKADVALEAAKNASCEASKAQKTSNKASH